MDTRSFNQTGLHSFIAAGVLLPDKAVWIPNESRNLDYLAGADLFCIVFSSAPADWSVWLKRTDQAGHAQNVTVSKHTIRSLTSGSVRELVLQIRNATEQDAGTYICRAQFAGVIQEDTLRLAVTGNKKM